MSNFSPLGTLPTQPAAQQPAAANVATGVAGFLQGLMAVNDRRNQQKIESEKLALFKQQQAEGHLNKLAEVLRSNPDRRKDPTLVAQARQWSKDAQLPNPVDQVAATPGTATNEGVPGQPGQVGAGANPLMGEHPATPSAPAREQINMDVLDPKPDIRTIDTKLLEYAQSLPPGPARDSIFGRFSNVPEGMRIAPRVLGTAEKTQAVTRVTDAITKLGSGTISKPQALIELEALTNNANDLGWNLDRVKSMVQALAPEDTSGALIQAKVDEFSKLGLSAQANAAYKDFLTKNTGQHWADQIKIQNGKLAVSEENAGTNAARLQETIRFDTSKMNNAVTRNANEKTKSEAAMIAAKAAAKRAETGANDSARKDIGLATTQVHQAITGQNAAIADLTREYSAAVNAGHPELITAPGPKDAQGNPTPSLAQQLLDAKKRLGTLQTTEKSLLESEGGVVVNFLKQVSGNDSVKPTGSATPVHTGDAPYHDPTGKGVWQVGDHYEYADGKPYTPPAK